MKKAVIFVIFAIFVIGISLFWTGCKSKNEVKETTTTESTTSTASTETTTTTTTTEVADEKITDEEINEVQALIDKAKRFGAEEYDPDNLAQANDNLKNATDENLNDVTKARNFLEGSKKHAILAYENSLKARVSLMKDEIDALFAEADSLGADKFFENEYNDVKTLYSQGDENLNNENYEEAFSNFSDCKNSLDNLITSTKTARKEYEDSIDEVKKLIGEADKTGAQVYAKSDYDEANSLLEEGVNNYTDYNLSDAKDNLDKAKEAVLSAIEKTKLALKEKLRKEAVKAIFDAGKTIENASKKPTLNNKDQKTNNNYEFEFDENDKNLSNAPDDEDLSYKDILEKSIEYIEKAKESYKNEDYEQAIKYAQISKKLAESYQGEGIKTSYTVVLNPSNRDCLWRISSYSFIYNNPYLWPRIWKANKNIILNPDLIFPGQIFLIPEMD